jgi:HEAT repeat protein
MQTPSTAADVAGPRDADAIVSRSEQRARLVRQIYRDAPSGNQASIIRRLAYPDNSSTQKMDLMQRLSHCVRVGDRKSVIAVVQLLHDPDAAVRSAALDALERLIPMHSARDFDGRREVIAALGHMCTDYNKYSRQKALDLLVAVAEKSDPDVLAAVMSEVFKESDELPLYARLAAVSAVPAVVKNDDLWAIRPLISELENEDPEVRRTTISSLRRIARRGNAEVIAALCKHLRDNSFAVRMLVIDSITELGTKGDMRIIDQLSDVLDDCENDSPFTLPLVKALVSISEPGCDRTINCLLSLVNAPDVNIRLFASESIGVMAPYGHIPSCTTLMSKLNRETTQLITHNSIIKGAEQKKEPKRPVNSKSFTLSDSDFRTEIQKFSPKEASIAAAPPGMAADASTDPRERPRVHGAIDADLSSEASTASTASTGEDAEDEHTANRDDEENVTGEIASRGELATHADTKAEDKGGLRHESEVVVSLSSSKNDGESVDVIKGVNLLTIEDMSAQEEEEEGHRLSLLPLTPPYPPKGAASRTGQWQTPEHGEGWMPKQGLKLGKFEVEIPPLKTPILSPLSALRTEPR